MRREIWPVAAVLAIMGCGGANAPEAPASRASEPRDASVLDPSAGSIERAEGVQQTVDDEAAELRRRIEEAER